MPRLGSHMSIAGGYHKAVEAAKQEGCDVVQLFTTPPRQWPVDRLSPTSRDAAGVKRGGTSAISDDDVTCFQAMLAQLGIGDPLVHASYLINLASPDATLWKKSVDALVVEMRRAERLGIPFVVVHPGAYTTSSEALGIGRVIDALNEVELQTRNASVMCLLETTAGQGSTLGHCFEHLAAMLEGTQNSQRFALCFDTCHAFSAGYPMGTLREYKRTMKQLEQAVGKNAIRAIHLNDSATPFGARKDRHAHIGRGEMGITPFCHLLNDPRFQSVPMYLETEKGNENGESWDQINLRTLRNLIEP